MKNIFKEYNVKNIKTEINRYGFNYSTKDFMIQAFGIISLVLVVAYLSRLELRYILILVLITMCLIPFIIKAWFLQSYNIKKFTMLTDYLGNIIPIFSQKTKIRYTLGELLDITNGSMKESIAKAINYLDNTVDDPDMAKNALKIIEDEFPNSRIKSVHKLLLSVESSNSTAYKDVCQNMYEDIEAWIKRVYTFQKELKNRRNKLLILCIATLFMNSIFVYIYISNEYFIGFTKLPIFQISTLIFTAIILVTITVVLTKLHGEWLINDTDYRKDDYIKKQYLFYKNGIPKLKAMDIITFLICIAGAVYMFIVKEYTLCAISVALSILVIGFPGGRHKAAYKVVSKSLTIEFPIWLREISLTLSNLTVLNAIERSITMASYPLKKEIIKFLDEAKKDPSSIKPYNNFLIDYDLEDARSSMKVLYAIQNIGKEDVKDRISNLIVRNQEMLDKAESIRNNDSISGIEALGYVPTIVFSIQMLVSMFAMFSYMMAAISGAINL